MDIYNIVVPKDSPLRRFNELIDFSFVYVELIDECRPDNGKNAMNSIRIFKYFLFKLIFDLSDLDIVEHSKNDMSFYKRVDKLL